MANTRHDPNQELIGQGIANMLSPLFGGFAATGALARTATNVRYGATGPFRASFTRCCFSLVLLLLAPLAGEIPLACLAAILFVVAFNMSDLPHVWRLIRSAPRADVVILADHVCAYGLRRPRDRGQRGRHSGDAAVPAPHVFIG